MNLLKKIIDFYVFSNIHVALATFCLVEITLKTSTNSLNIFSFFVFFATLLSYNFIRLYRKEEIKSWFYTWIGKNKIALYTISVLSFLAVIFYGWQLNKTTLIALIPLAFFTFFYVVPFRGKQSLRTLSGFKLFLIAFCWAFVTVILPVLNSEIDLDKDVVITFLQRFFFVAAITLPFDIRDVSFDSNSLKTIPQVIGIAKAKRLGILFLMLFLGLNFFKTNHAFLQVELVVFLISLFLLMRATPNQNRYYSAFWVEAIPIFWYVLIFFFYKFN